MPPLSGVDLFSGLGGKIRIGVGAKSDHGVETLYVYLLTSSILYKNTAYFGGGCKMMYSPVLFIIGWAIAPPAPRFDAPASTNIIHIHTIIVTVYIYYLRLFLFYRFAGLHYTTRNDLCI